MVDQLQGDGAKEEGEISNNVEEDLRKLNETNTKLIQEATSSSSPNSLRPCYSNENLNENQERSKLNQEEDINQDMSQGENVVAISTEAIESQKEKDKEVPGCLIDFRDKVEACSHRLQQWSDEQELKARQKQSRRREKRDGGVRVDEEGKVVEPSGDNFFERKGIIPLVAVILSWVNVVFLWRICSDSIRKEERATASRGEGIGFLVGFIILWLLTIWSYIKVVITGPGYVRDHLPIAEQPPSPKDDAFNDLQEPSTDLQLSASTDSADPEENQEISNLRTEEEQIVPYPKTINETHEESVDPTIAATLGPVGVGMVAQADEAEKVKSDLASGSDEQSRTDQADQLSRPQSKAIPDPDAWAGPSVNPNNVVPFAAENQNPTTFPEPKRLPQKSQPLHPSNTFCYRCRRYKPPRSHHCRHCGTCVLKMDHHCPWVGGCVGARNHKFFYNFLQWVTALEYYVLVINSILFNRGIRRRSIAGDNWTIDGYMISLFPICALFILFTTALLITHTYLFIVNLSTIEHMGVDRQKVREDVLIETWVKERARVEGRPKPSWFDHVRERNKLKAKWSSYWGKPKTEANLFWIDGRFKPIIVGQEDQIGNLSKIRITERSDSQNIPSLSWYHAIGPNWRQSMGDNVFGWFLPISRSKNANGLAYEANWRFGPQGEWTARKDWSKRLIAVDAANQ